MQQEKAIHPSQPDADTPRVAREPLRDGMDILITDKDGVTYYSLRSPSEQYVGGFEVAIFNEKDLDDPEVSVRWRTTEGFGNAPRMAGEYIEAVEQAVLGENFEVHDVYGCVGTAMTAGAEIFLDRAPDLGDFEHMHQEASGNGFEEVSMFKYRWPGNKDMPRGELWHVSDRLTVRSYVEGNILGEKGITALKDFYTNTALYPEYTQDFKAVLGRAFDVQFEK